jgi:hypothetical protein
MQVLVLGCYVVLCGEAHNHMFMVDGGEFNIKKMTWSNTHF